MNSLSLLLLIGPIIRCTCLIHVRPVFHGSGARLSRLRNLRLLRDIISRVSSKRKRKKISLSKVCPMVMVRPTAKHPVCVHVEVRLVCLQP